MRIPARAFTRILAAALLAGGSGLACACGDDLVSLGDTRDYPGGGEPQLGDCTEDADCPAGLVCRVGLCVSPEDNRPPEVEQDHSFNRPVASANYVYAVSPLSDSAAVIDPVNLSIEAVILPEEPVDAEVIPGRDAAVILSRRGEAISLLTTEAGGSTLVTRRTRRKFSALSVSPDGRWAVLWTPEGVLPDAGAEGIVGFVELSRLARGEEVLPIERSAGRRHTDVLFRTQPNGLTADVVIVGKEEVAIFALATVEALETPERIRLPEGLQEIASREAIGAPDGSYVLFRSYAAPELGVLEVAPRRLSSVALPAIATDVDVSPDGTLGIAALRTSGQLAWFPLPGVLADPGLLRLVDSAGLIAGQVELSADAGLAVVFTNSEDSEEFGTLDLTAAAPAVEIFTYLQKWVESIGLSPDGRTAVVIHRPNPDSTVADLYERDVDGQQGYSVVDLAGGYAQLKLTGTVPPLEFVFSADGAHAAVTLRDDRTRLFRVDAVDLETLVTDSLQLASAPEFAGALPATEESGARIWITQEHPAGRISFVDLAGRSVRTATGYELNSDID